jgi:hypothetical protein
MEDKLKTINSSLVKAMEDMRADENSTTRNTFIQELLNAKLIIPAEITPEPVDGKMPKNAVISFFSVKTANDENILYLFTSAEEFKKWELWKGKQLILQNYSQFKTFVTGKKATYDGFVIDPFGACVSIRRALIEKIETALKPMKVKNVRVNVGEGGLQPATYGSAGMFAALCKAMERNETINAAWMMQADRGANKTPLPVLVVDFTGGDQSVTFNALARTANEFLADNETIGIVPAQNVRTYIEYVEPFYIKGKRFVPVAGEELADNTKVVHDGELKNEIVLTLNKKK